MLLGSKSKNDVLKLVGILDFAHIGQTLNILFSNLNPYLIHASFNVKDIMKCIIQNILLFHTYNCQYSLYLELGMPYYI